MKNKRNDEKKKDSSDKYPYFDVTDYPEEEINEALRSSEKMSMDMWRKLDEW